MDFFQIEKEDKVTGATMFLYLDFIGKDNNLFISYEEDIDDTVVVKSLIELNEDDVEELRRFVAFVDQKEKRNKYE